MMLAGMAQLLVLLAHSDRGSRAVSDDILDKGLAGALLTELALRGSIDLENRAMVVRNPDQTGDHLLDETLTRISSHAKASTPKDWVYRLSPGLGKRVLDELVSSGLLI